MVLLRSKDKKIVIHIFTSFCRIISNVEQFSIECRKPTAMNVNSTINQSEFRANTCSRRQAREKACDQLQVTIGFDFASHWLTKWRELY